MTLYFVPVDPRHAHGKPGRKLNPVAVAAAILAAGAVLASAQNMAAEVVERDLIGAAEPGKGGQITAGRDFPDNSPILGNGPIDDHLLEPGELSLHSEIGDVFSDATCTPPTLACNAPLFAAPEMSLDITRPHALMDLNGPPQAFEKETAPTPHPTAASLFGFLIIVVGLISHRARRR